MKRNNQAVSPVGGLVSPSSSSSREGPLQNTEHSPTVVKIYTHQDAYGDLQLLGENRYGKFTSPTKKGFCVVC